MLHTVGMTGRSATVLAYGLAALVLSTPGAAETQAAPPPAELMMKERPTTKSFYGWKILLTGEVGGLAAGASLILPDTPLGSLPSTVGFLVGMPAYVLGGPVTHWSYGDFTKGLISLGGNIMMPIIGGLAGGAVRCGLRDAAEDCGTRGFFTGFAIALVTMPVIDALVLGWDHVPVEESFSTAEPGRRTSSNPGRAMRWSVAPAWSMEPKGAFQLGVAGKF
jgi:hypothetical protein